MSYRWKTDVIKCNNVVAVYGMKCGTEYYHDNTYEDNGFLGYDTIQLHK